MVCSPQLILVDARPKEKCARHSISRNVMQDITRSCGCLLHTAATTPVYDKIFRDGALFAEAKAVILWTQKAFKP
jgi:hypothetical protein